MIRLLPHDHRAAWIFPGGGGGGREVCVCVPGAQQQMSGLSPCVPFQLHVLQGIHENLERDGRSGIGSFSHFITFCRAANGPIR